MKSKKPTAPDIRCSIPCAICGQPIYMGPETFKRVKHPESCVHMVCKRNSVARGGY